MPDWEQLVAERLAQIQLTPEVRRDVIAEIAAHLDECYTELVKAGRSDPEAETLRQVSDWNALRRNIRRAKEDRMAFARKVVMPGAAAAIVALIALKLYVYLLIVPEPCGVDATCIRVSADGPVYYPWLATLLPVGAFAAALARRMGATPLQRLTAALFPALYLGLENLAMALLFEFFWRIPIYWVLIPAIACALGAWPFLRGRRDPLETQPAVAAHP